MTEATNELVNRVSTREEAEKIVRVLLNKFTTDAAYDSVISEAKQIKQRPEVVLKRKVNNLFRSLSTRRG
jgi:hypothetical protein